MLETQAKKSSAVVIPLRPHGRDPLSQGNHDPAAISLDIVPAEVFPRVFERESARWFGGALALAVHAAVLGVLWLGFWAVEPSGGGGQYLEAISVSLVPSQVLEAPDQKPNAMKGGSIADAVPAEGAPEPRERSIESQSDQAEQPEAKVEPPAPRQEDALPTNRKPPRQKTTAQSAGGSTARALSELGDAAAVAGATPGEISRYAMVVRAALARSKPRGMHKQATVTVTFGIGESGEVRFARITESSGHPMLDEATVAAVQRTSFPRPPTGMNAKQLTYVIPFRFK